MPALFLGLGTALAWLGKTLLIGFFMVFSSVIGQGIFAVLVMLALSYFASTKIEAVKWIFEQIPSGIASDTSINFQALGTVIEALRFDDILFVYINAYVLGILIKFTASAIGTSRARLPA